VILFSADLSLAVKWRNPVTGKGVSGEAHAMLTERRKRDEEAEENRLLYVAMTRAEDHLILSYARRKQSMKWQKLVEPAVPGATETDLAPKPEAESLRHLESSSPVQNIRRPAVAGQYDSSAAVTSVTQFLACPRKYYLGRYLGLEAAALLTGFRGPGTGAIQLGLEVHRALTGEATDSPEARELSDRFATSELGRRAARATRLEREFDFLLAVEDVVLRGQIDLWFEESGELVLVDYKTDRHESPGGESAEYALQLRLYALALKTHAGRLPDRAALCYLRSGRVREVSLTPGDLDAARQAVRALATAQDRLEFPMQVGEQCRRCSFYQGLCPAPEL
jgi:ATP-dependent exoDNAse (exonuclease V) beta subunit